MNSLLAAASTATTRIGEIYLGKKRVTPQRCNDFDGSSVALKKNFPDENPDLFTPVHTTP
jgi:hypothetical protein